MEQFGSDGHGILAHIHPALHSSVIRGVLDYVSPCDRIFHRHASIPAIRKQPGLALSPEFCLALHVPPENDRGIALNARAGGKKDQTEPKQLPLELHPSTTSTVCAPTLRICSAVLAGLKLGSSASITSRNRSSVARCALR